MMLPPSDLRANRRNEGDRRAQLTGDAWLKVSRRFRSYVRRSARGAVDAGRYRRSPRR